MKLSPLLIATLLTCATLHAQQPQQPLILLDPAGGGADNGARVAEGVYEKEATLLLANRIAPRLRARGFTVELTRDADTDVPSDARAALANNTHPLACILLYAAGTGTGIHLYTTALPNTALDTTRPALWDEAQAPFAGRSHLLAQDLQAAFSRARMSVSSGQTWIRPLDNMQCPALALEVSGVTEGPAADDLTYQGHIADIIAATMLAWRTRVQAMTPPPPAPTTPAPAAPKPTAPATPPPGAPAATPRTTP